jgi:hypothetical protein
MLVGMFNAVKVECVPLNLKKFAAAGLTRVNAGTSNSVRQG